MKNLKALVTTMAAAAMLVLLPDATAMTADAAAPKNYAIRYDADNNDWRYQEGSVFDEDEQERELYYLLQDLKDGDLVAVYNDDCTTAPMLDLGNVKLGNLTICRVASAAVLTGGVSECHILAGSYCAINGDVDNAYVYDVATVTFNDNVDTLVATAERSDFNSNISCAGTVWHFHAYSLNDPKTFYDLYNFDRGKFEVDDGNLETEYYFYDQYAVKGATAQTTGATPAVTAPTAASSSGVYDDVPKTGESPLALCFLGAAALCMAGSLGLRRRTR